MIQATDLRIGNYYLLNSRVIELDEELMYEIFTPYTGASLASLEPIPLSPEVLEACGFEKHGAIWIHPTTMLIELWNRARLEGNLHLIAGRMQKDSFLAVSGRIEHLHQLMNLFHCATGTELTVNIEQVKV